MKLLMRSVVGLQSRDILFEMISTTHCSCYKQCLVCVNGSLYWDCHQSCVRLQLYVGIRVVPTADAVVTREEYCYNCIVRLCSILSFPEMISVEKRRDAPWLARMR